MKKELKKLLEPYKKEEKKPDQQEMEELLKKVQELYGGVLKESAVDKICKELDIRHKEIKAAVKSVSAEKTEKKQHKLRICDGKKCMSRGNEDLQKYIEKTYQVKPGEVSEKGKFSYKFCGCLKKCKDGPCVKWDGEVYTEMTPKRLDKLVENR